ncbi:MAG TPA: hypothetical protein VFE63_06335 [Roseiarcus sp.]|jgi:hypothetical protein|nr:hypothetical protein [Roseiarcus sp.]
MATVSLQEAAESLGASKADVWRAIRAGSLSAQRTGDGGFAIDSDELFRVFERPPPAQPPVQPDATTSLLMQPDATTLPPVQPDATVSPASAPETSAMPETAAMDEMAVAFAALQAELRGLLGPLAGAPASEPRRVENETRARTEPLVASPEQQPLRDDAAAERPNGAIDKTKAEPPIPAPASEKDAEPSPLKRPWWKRLAG